MDARHIASIPSELRMYAHDDSGGKHVETHLCSHAAARIEVLEAELKRLLEKHGEQQTADVLAGKVK